VKGLRIRKPVPPPEESVLAKVPRSVDEGVARWCVFIILVSEGGGRFNLGFRKADKIRFVKVYKIRQDCIVISKESLESFSEE